MDVVKMARLLEPLMPREVQKWLRAREMADPELRSLIEKQIASTAHRVLGDPNQRILLSLPPEKTARGTFNLGTVVYDRERWPFGLSRSELLEHVAIYGRSGAGKTNVVFCLLTQLAEKKIPFLFLDWKRTCRHLIPILGKKIKVYTPGRSLSPLPFNPFIAPPGLEERVYLHQVVDVLGEAFTLGDGSRSLMHKALAACYDSGDHGPSVAKVLAELEKLPVRERGHGWKISARRALESLELADLTGGDARTQEEMARSLLRRNTVLELDGLGQGAKKFLIPLLCLWVYYAKLGSPEREKLRLVIVLEEAHHVLHRGERRAKETVMEMLLRQLRELGVAVVIVDQHPHLMSSAALGNVFASICMNLKDPADANKAAGFSLVEDKDKRFFGMLPVGWGIVKIQDRWNRPFLVRFPHVPVSKGEVTDRRLAGFLRGESTGSGATGAHEGYLGHGRRVLARDDCLTGEELAFLGDVAQHRDDGVKTRYRRLGLSAEKGTRIKASLVRRGWLDAERVPIGNTRMVMLRLTKAAKQVLGIDGAQEGYHESIPHEYWKRYHAGLYEDVGYTVRIEAPRVGGRVDVLAEKNGRRVGIEVESGQSNAVENVRRCLRSGHDTVVVVATDDKAMDKVEKQLARAGLLIPSRVTIVLRDKLKMPRRSETIQSPRNA